MPRPPRLSLAILAPLCLVLLYLSLVGAACYYEKSQLQARVAEDYLVQVHRLMFRLQHLTVDALATQDTVRIAKEVSLVATDPELMVLVLVDPSDKIHIANHRVWQSSLASQVIDGYDAALHQQVVGSGKPWVAPNPERLSIQAYYPVSGRDVPVYSNIDLIYLELDLSGVYHRAANAMQQRLLVFLSGGAILTLLVLLLFHYLGLSPLRRLLRLARKGDTGALGQLLPRASREVAGLQQSLHTAQFKLHHSLNQLQDLERRCLFAMESSQNGLWEWRPGADDMFLSDRCKAILGFESSGLANDYQSWRSRLHPDDKDQVQARMQWCLAGNAEPYESRHRVRHSRGYYLWVVERGMVVQWHEDGRPAMLIGDLRQASDVPQRQLSAIAVMPSASKGVGRHVTEDEVSA